MVRYDVIRVNRSEVHSAPVLVAPWETPVLVLVNGDDRCFPEGTVDTPNEYPEAQGEYDRLGIKYRSDSDSGQSYVGIVYGVGSIGVQRLRKAIEDARQAATAEPEEEEVETVSDDDLKSLGLFTDAPAMAQGARAIEQ